MSQKLLDTFTCISEIASSFSQRVEVEKARNHRDSKQTATIKIRANTESEKIFVNSLEKHGVQLGLTKIFQPYIPQLLLQANLNANNYHIKSYESLEETLAELHRLYNLSSTSYRNYFHNIRKIVSNNTLNPAISPISKDPNAESPKFERVKQYTPLEIMQFTLSQLSKQDLGYAPQETLEDNMNLLPRSNSIAELTLETPLVDFTFSAKEMKEASSSIASLINQHRTLLADTVKTYTLARELSSILEEIDETMECDGEDGGVGENGDVGENQKKGEGDKNIDKEHKNINFTDSVNYSKYQRIQNWVDACLSLQTLSTEKSMIADSGLDNPNNLIDSNPTTRFSDLSKSLRKLHPSQAETILSTIRQSSVDKVRKLLEKEDFKTQKKTSPSADMSSEEGSDGSVDTFHDLAELHQVKTQVTHLESLKGDLQTSHNQFQDQVEDIIFKIDRSNYLSAQVRIIFIVERS